MRGREFHTTRAGVIVRANIKSMFITAALILIAVVFMSKYVLSNSMVSMMIIAALAGGLSILFMLRYELGLICFVLSFAYQVSVFFFPQYGLAAIVRLDEFIYGCVALAWLMRLLMKQHRMESGWPLISPLKLYCIAAVISLVFNFGNFFITPFIVTATGLKGFLVAAFKFSAGVVGYMTFAVSGIRSQVRRALIWCLFAAGATSAVLNYLRSQGLLFYYDPNYWYYRFGGLVGSTSSVNVFGDFMMHNIWLALALSFVAASYRISLISILFLPVYIYLLLLSGTKASMAGLVIGLVFLTIFSWRRMGKQVVITIVILTLVMSAAWWLVNHITSNVQRSGILFELGRIPLAMYSKEGFEQTSAATRRDHVFRFFEGIRRNPWIPIFGAGFMSRQLHPYGDSLHNDFLTLTHDVGFLGPIALLWIIWASIRHFRPSRTTNQIDRRFASFCACLQAMIISIFVTMFANEHFTVYWTADPIFIWIMVLLAVTGGYVRTIRTSSSYQTVRTDYGQGIELD